jgi:hypothetical protein
MPTALQSGIAVPVVVVAAGGAGVVFGELAAVLLLPPQAEARSAKAITMIKVLFIGTAFCRLVRFLAPPVAMPLA